MLNNRIFYQDHKINKFVFCCPDNKFHYLNDTKEFVEVPFIVEVKL